MPIRSLWVQGTRHLRIVSRPCERTTSAPFPGHSSCSYEHIRSELIQRSPSSPTGRDLRAGMSDLALPCIETFMPIGQATGRLRAVVRQGFCERMMAWIEPGTPQIDEIHAVDRQVPHPGLQHRTVRSWYKGTTTMSSISWRSALASRRMRSRPVRRHRALANRNRSGHSA